MPKKRVSRENTDCVYIAEKPATGRVPDDGGNKKSVGAKYKKVRGIQYSHDTHTHTHTVRERLCHRDYFHKNVCLRKSEIARARFCSITIGTFTHNRVSNTI